MNDEVKRKNKVATEGGCYLLGSVFLLLVSMTIDPTTLPNGAQGAALLGFFFLLKSLFCLWEYYYGHEEE